MQFKRSVLAAATVALAASVLPAMAKPFKWAGSSDIQTMDIHSQNSALGNGIHGAVYESLVMFNSRTLKVEPVLATSWQQVSPTQMRFKLRQGVKFSDGSAMTADDVVYSLQRAMSKTSTYAIYTQGMDRIAKVDGETIDIFLKNPNPVLLNQLTELRVMSRAWAEKHNSVEPKDIKSKEETYSHRHAMGTGPFVLKEWVPDQKIVTETGVTIVGYTDFPSRMAAQASTLYSTNIRHMLTDLTPKKDGVILHNMEDDVIRGATVAHVGAVTYPPPPPKIAAIAAQKPKEKARELTPGERRAQEVAAFKSQTRSQVGLLAIGGAVVGTFADVSRGGAGGEANGERGGRK